MTPTELRKAGEYLYGEQWIPHLAQQIGYSLRQMNRLADGVGRINTRAESMILSLVADKLTMPDTSEDIVRKFTGGML
ncbi:hypothetical protein KGP36_06910 [Patescibacteria group bacterium]|nr:hypothetical protein [Patescibacteria group bacterium]